MHLRTTSPSKINAMAPDNPKLIDHHDAAWIHCPGRGPDVPTLKTLYLLNTANQSFVASGNGIQVHPSKIRCKNFKKTTFG